MSPRYLLSVAVAGLVIDVQSQPVAAQERDPFEKFEAINPEVLFKGIIREDDVTLLFEHVRESMAASARGEEPKESAAVTHRAEEIQREVAARGSVLVGVLLSAFESAAKQVIRDAMSDISSGNSRTRNAPPSSTSD
jgi:hypothetical protein